MIIKTETTVSFDPVREFQAMLDFERDHEDWRKIDDSTIATYFVKTDVVSVELKGEQGCREQPTIEPQRIKGRWERRESDLSWWYECSVCGESPLFDPYEHEVRTPFCPWCGARMEEEEDAVD